MNEDKTVDLCPNIAKDIFEAILVEWTGEAEDKDYALAVREWVEIGRQGCQYVINELILANEIRKADMWYRLEAESLPDLEL